MTIPEIRDWWAAHPGRIPQPGDPGYGTDIAGGGFNTQPAIPAQPQPRIDTRPRIPIRTPDEQAAHRAALVRQRLADWVANQRRWGANPSAAEIVNATARFQNGGVPDPMPRPLRFRGPER